MRDVLEATNRWRAAGRRFAVATLVAVHGSAPRRPGAALAVSEDGEVVGSISGGCLESDVVDAARTAIATGRPRAIGFDDAGDPEFGALTCGGRLDVFVDPTDDADVAAAATAALHRDRLAIVGTRLDPNGAGRSAVVTAEAVTGDLGSRAALTTLRRELTTAGDAEDGVVTCADGARLFVRRLEPRPEMWIFGAIDFASATARIGAFLGFRVTVVDARAPFATPARHTAADDVVVEWPDEWLARRPIAATTALVILTHDEKFDVPLLRLALASDAAYVGVMGSRRTHERRLRALRAVGVDPSLFARMHAPIGLDIGARTPEEVAIAIAAEIVATRRRRSGRPLSLTATPIAGDRSAHLTA